MRRGGSSNGDAQSVLCGNCPLRALPFCAAAIGDPGYEGDIVRPRHMTARQRQILYRRHQKSADVILIREGWAFRFAVSANGRRQIQSILLPGDVLSIPSIFREKLGSSVQTMTPLSYCAFNRDQLWRFLDKSPKALKEITAICVDERERCDQQMIDLVTRSAEERIVLLVLDLFERLTKLNLVQNHSFLFPLTQQQLADAVGLTQVHVNRVLRRLKKDNLIEISRGTLQIKDLAALKDIAQAR